MNHRSLAFTLLVCAMLVSIAFGLFVAQSAERPSPTGEVSQSPYIYLIFTILLFTMGFLLSKVLAGENSKFSFAAFLNVCFAALLISGLAHEFVHILLINHPVQMRFHFGDSNAIFSTCCLSPGEAPYEEVAYAIQFMVLILWIFFSRHTFYNGRFRELWKYNFTKNDSKFIPAKNTKKKNIPAKKTSEWDEEDLEREWNEHKTAMENNLSRKTKPAQRGKQSDLEDDVQKIGRLKV
ncbi:MAG: hypothetical protein FJY86_00045 [Candidatus Diapherotrites archaeon]|uniref:Uncharacterized protein n=1 Tax=Candidatus Iainarchaeum sp. TaxID=3101447 RepID=A0A8T4C6A9_9ARCH|nr:hypothetical protein [Candidatus Diapherotrites archaeon]